MPVQDGLQFATTLTVTSSGATVAYGIRATMFRIINDGAGSAFFDFTGGNVTASTTGSSFQIKTGENFQPPPAAYPGYYTGLSCVSSSGGTAVVRILALR